MASTAAAGDGHNGAIAEQTTITSTTSMAVLETNPALDDLCKLPAELRNRIIELYIQDLAPFKSISLPSAVKFNTERDQEPSLAFCNRQLREETLSCFYSSNEFLFGNLDNIVFRIWGSARKWLDCKIQIPHIHYIGNFKISLCEMHRDTTLTIHAARGTQAFYTLDVQEDPLYSQMYDNINACVMAPTWSNMRTQLQQLCEKVGFEGFSAADYITAVDICIAATPEETCMTLWDGEFGEDSDDHHDDDEQDYDEENDEADEDEAGEDGAGEDKDEDKHKD